ncbi:MAG TPA: Hsp20 family protein [Acidimicrobiia bacterium]|nr:Hsp20 family protein [Acidimicrobiia bacterium]
MLVRYFDPFARLGRARRGLTPFEPFGAWPFDSMTRMMRESLDMLDAAFGGNAEAPLVTVEDGMARIEIVAPGLDPETDLSVELNGTVLTVTGGHDTHEENGNGARRYSRFAYRWDLGREVNADDLRASYDAGILTVEIPLPEEETEGRKIPVTAGKQEAIAASSEN